MGQKWKSDAPEPEFDQDLANTYIGKSILVGISYFDHQGQLIEQRQMHGIVQAADGSGITIALEGLQSGESFVMPPALNAIHTASPGIYTLRSTGETVENPDLFSTWSVTKPLLH